MVEGNLLGAMTATEVFVDQLGAGNGGELVNVSPVASRVPSARLRRLAMTEDFARRAGVYAEYRHTGG